jgi:hypothetical protein
MQEREFAAIGRATVKVGMSLVMLIFLAGSLWVLNDLWGSLHRGEVQDVVEWVLCAFAGSFAVLIGGSAAYSLYVYWFGKEEPFG